jgi:hypothetical protein
MKLALLKTLPIILVAGLVGCGSNVTIFTQLQKFETTTPFQVKTENGTLVQIEDESEISNIDFADEGHGWLIMKATLANGEKSTFHLGIKTREALRVLSLREHVINTNLTKQAVALKFIPVSSDTETDVDEYTENCSETRFETVCRHDPLTHRPVCRQEPYSVFGQRTVTIQTTTDDHLYNIQFLSANLGSVHATATMSSRVRNQHRSYGPCIVRNSPPPFPYPAPFPHNGRHR